MKIHSLYVLLSQFETSLLFHVWFSFASWPAYRFHRRQVRWSGISISKNFPQFVVFYTVTSLVAQMVKHLPTMRETWVRSLGWEDLLEKEMAPYSSTLAWKIPWVEEPGRLQSMGSQRVRHDWATSLHFMTITLQPKEPTQVNYKIRIPLQQITFWSEQI